MNIAKALAVEFSFMRAKPEINKPAGNLDDMYISDLYTAFGCECGPGWYELLRSLCKEIVQAYAEKGLEPDIEIHQIKEKYGTLRFYYGSSIDLYEIVSKYEDLSETTCENCGKPGQLYKEYWFKVRCDECYEEENRPKQKRVHPLIEHQKEYQKAFSNLAQNGSTWAEDTSSFTQPPQEA